MPRSRVCLALWYFETAFVSTDWASAHLVKCTSARLGVGQTTRPGLCAGCAAAGQRSASPILGVGARDRRSRAREVPRRDGLRPSRGECACGPVHKGRDHTQAAAARPVGHVRGFPGRSPLCRREPVLCDLPRGIAYREARLRLVVSGELQDALREHAQAISPAPFAMT